MSSSIANLNDKSPNAGVSPASYEIVLRYLDSTGEILMSGIVKDVIKNSVFANFSRLMVNLKPVGESMLIFVVRFVPLIYLFITQKKRSSEELLFKLKVKTLLYYPSTLIFLTKNVR